jgi:hypothetical protein
VLEKHNTKVSLRELKKIVKIMLFSIGAVSIASYMIHLSKNKNKTK